MGKVWMIASGKGGVGKTTLTAGLAVSLAQKGKKIGVVDVCTGLKSVDLLLGMQNRVVFDLFDVAENSCTLEQALVSHEKYPNLHLLSTSQIESPDALKARRLESIVKKLRKRFEIVLIDCPPGVGSAIQDIAETADACLLVVTPDDASMRDAERLSSMLFEKNRMEMHLAVNCVNEKMIWDGLMLLPEQIATTLDVPLIGEIPADESVYRALLQHQSVVETGERSVSSAIDNLALRMMGNELPFKTYRVRRRKWFHHAES